MKHFIHINRAITKAAALMLLPLLACSCQWMNGDYDDCEMDDSAARYINFTLSVSSEKTAATRAPQGGEYGDGREASFERENTVNGITIILYKGTGVNDANAKIDFLRYYTVTRVGNPDAQGTTNYLENHEQYEATYTTGDQKLGPTDVDFNASYHVLIVANQNLTNVFYKGMPISQVLDYQTQDIYTAPATVGQPQGYQYFVMTTERDATIDFQNKIPVPKEGVEEGVAYRFTNLLLIERLSARIDYNTTGSTYNTTRGGYEYTCYDGDNNSENDDQFVVTKVTPFNLYNEPEYLFKRVRTDWTDGATISWFGDEVKRSSDTAPGNYVVDPATARKDNSTTLAYLSPVAEEMSTTYAQTMNSLSADQKFQIGGKDNIIIAYPRENTLQPASHLKQYATGIAFEGNYYARKTDGSFTEPQKMVFYYYLRHQGEPATTTNPTPSPYQAKMWSSLTDDETGAEDVAMNYSIVRNNIYRVTIEQINVVQGIIKIKLEEKHWRHVDNPQIYI
jgi:hypothetical protein